MNYLIKILGVILILVGVAVIIYGLYSSYNIFTAKSEVPEIFKVPEKAISSPKKTPTEGIEAQLEKMVGEQLKTIIPTIFPIEFLVQLLNLTSWSIFAGLLIFGGAQISNLGIKLLKD